MQNNDDKKQVFADGGAAACEVRCHCGSLLARRVPGGIELLCRRCKRRMIVPLDPGESRTV